MRAVVETNILIRAVIKPDGTVGPIVTRLAAADDQSWIIVAFVTRMF